MEVFQSLGRDSGCSSEWQGASDEYVHSVSIPRSGFWVFKLEPGTGPTGEATVSIPRSGFWVFKPCCRTSTRGNDLKFQSLGRDSGCSSTSRRWIRLRKRQSFNPSVGILGVQARRTWWRNSRPGPFQSLGRDSGCSSCKDSASEAIS